MNQQRDIERLLDHWFEHGPDQAPDRVVDIVTNRIERQSQRPAWRLQRRPFPVNAYSKIAVAAAAALIAAVIGFNLLKGSSTSVGAPSATPGASARPSPSATSSASATPSAGFVCEDDLAGCAGPLQAGAHGSSLFGPRLIHYVTPAGWTNSIDTTTIYKLDSPGGGTSILLWTGVSIEDQTPTSCEPVVMAGGNSPSAAQWVSYLSSHRGLVTTTPSPANFPGDRDKNGQSMNISMDPAWTQTCPGRTGPEVMFIAHTSQPSAVYGVGPADRLHLVVLDTVSYGPATVLTEVYGPSDEAGFSAAVDLARGVMDTFVFGCGPGAGYGPCSGYPASTSTPTP
jgi:hypothetical protein